MEYFLQPQSTKSFFELICYYSHSIHTEIIQNWNDDNLIQLKCFQYNFLFSQYAAHSKTVHKDRQIDRSGEQNQYDESWIPNGYLSICPSLQAITWVIIEISWGNLVHVFPGILRRLTFQMGPQDAVNRKITNYQSYINQTGWKFFANHTHRIV